jgi:hypothetical protein
MFFTSPTTTKIVRLLCPSYHECVGELTLIKNGQAWKNVASMTKPYCQILSKYVYVNLWGDSILKIRRQQCENKIDI